MRGLELATLCLTVCFINGVTATLNDGLYVSNGSDILLIPNPNSISSDLISVYQQTGTIVGIAYEKSSGLLFWSTVDVMTRGIYRGNTDSTGNILNVTKIVDHDVLEVNCLTFDWISKHLYWTDSRKKTVEVSDPDGKNRRILLMDGMLSPRGIYADPKNGYLFWTDQGHKRIERSRLDGSERKVIVQQIGLPNQIIVRDSTLYWVNSDGKKFESSDFEGGHRQSTNLNIQGISEHVYGLAINGNDAYITKWNPGKLIRVDLNNNRVLDAAGNLGTGKIFSAVYVKTENQPSGNNPCASKGCQALCLPKSTSDARCSCPSYGAKTLNSDKRSCGTPSSVLLFAVASSGYVCFRDPTAAPTEAETYVVGRSLRPVAVAYDSITQVVYWSDVRERTVHSAKIDGSSPRILLGSQHGIGLVEGMVVDTVRRQLFYTNIGSVLLEGTPYSWHRVETIRLDADQVKVKTLVTTADKPRGLALDSTNGRLYYTDWGSRASIVRVELDGSNPTLIRTGLDNPNGIAIVSGKIYFVDSHFKTRNTQPNDRYPSTPKNGSLYTMNLDGTGYANAMMSSSAKFLTPFGLTASSSRDLYVSDWGTKSLTVLRNSQPTPFLSDVDEIMSVHFSQYSTSSSADGGCSSKSCSDMCLAKSSSVTECTCNSYGGKSVNGTSCVVPGNFILVADMNSIKIVSLDERDSNPYIAVQGNPYFANYAALTYDSGTQTVYYSDVNRRAIRALYLRNMTSDVFYRVNEVIDGLVFHDGKLYWTDYANGRISRLTIGETTHNAIVRNLKRPRGIQIHNNYIYWTEWGENPRVARKSLSSSIASSPEILHSNTQSPKPVWPNGLFIDSDKSRLYFVDGSTKMIFNCSLTGGCQPVPGAEAVLKHAYDIWFLDGVFYYSDWKSRSINAFRPQSPETSWTVVGDLMRPTQMFISRSSVSSAPGCDSGRCSGGECVPLIVNSGCKCTDKTPSYDRKSCTSNPVGNCFHDGKTYTYGQQYVPRACVNCQCLGNAPYQLDPVYNNSLCERIECPPLDCPKEDQKEPSANECCPSCTKCGIRITNCPKDVVSLTLPKDLRFAVHEYLPAVRDCKGLSRVISFTKSPSGTIFEKGTTRVTITAKTSDQSDTDTCSYSVKVEDTTPPTIECPSNVNRYVTDESSVTVNWEPPKASDNVGLRGSPTSTPSWGSRFGVGVHTVTYTATDTAGLTNKCSFSVNVTRLSSRQSCKIPNVPNADLKCNDDQNSLTCTIACNSGYKRTQERIDLTCRNGNWTREASEDALRAACIKEKQKAIIGKLKVTAPDICANEVDLRYTEKFLQYSVKKDFVRASGNQEVITARCKPPSKDLEVLVELRDDEGKSSREDTRRQLEEIKAELEKGFLKVNYRDGNGVHSAQTLTIQSPEVSNDCLPGQVEVNGNCEVCPAGKYQNSDKCENCEDNTYNDVEGQTMCKQCPNGMVSPSGSYIVDQCKAPDGVPFSMNFVIISSVCILLLIVGIPTVVFCVCSRRRSRFRQKRESMLHGNKAYGCLDIDDETYDKIAEPTMDPGPSPSNLNHYEILAGATPAPDDYDKIGMNEEGGEEAGGCSPGGSSHHSNASYLAPKSTPPYLTPVM